MMVFGKGQRGLGCCTLDYGCNDGEKMLDLGDILTSLDIWRPLDSKHSGLFSYTVVILPKTVHDGLLILYPFPDENHISCAKFELSIEVNLWPVELICSRYAGNRRWMGDIIAVIPYFTITIFGSFYSTLRFWKDAVGSWQMAMLGGRPELRLHGRQFLLIVKFQLLENWSLYKNLESTKYQYLHLSRLD